MVEIRLRGHKGTDFVKVSDEQAHRKYECENKDFRGGFSIEFHKDWLSNLKVNRGKREEGNDTTISHRRNARNC